MNYRQNHTSCRCVESGPTMDGFIEKLAILALAAHVVLGVIVWTLIIVA